MQGKIVVITGGTSGVGQAAAEDLAGRGARLILVARDKARAEATLARLHQLGPTANHGAHFGDLSSVRETRRLALEIAAAEPRIDVLINNAGIMGERARETNREGLERTFATNHMAYFVLTMALLDRLRSAAPARIINTASNLAMVAKLDFDDLQSTRKYSAYDAYCKSKLCNIYVTRMLAKRLGGTGITVNAWNPGFTETRLFEGKPLVVRLVNKLFGGKAGARATTLVHLATAPEFTTITGTYWARMKSTPMSPTALDDAQAERLWKVTEELGAGIS
jgi:NAD(P)-dependent dehydrogenase (short-subunit alcohol dehydrogenase family)